MKSEEIRNSKLDIKLLKTRWPNPNTQSKRITPCPPVGGHPSVRGELIPLSEGVSTKVDGVVSLSPCHSGIFSGRKNIRNLGRSLRFWINFRAELWNFPEWQKEERKPRIRERFFVASLLRMTREKNKILGLLGSRTSKGSPTSKKCIERSGWDLKLTSASKD